jgi:hypothetical protein
MTMTTAVTETLESRILREIQTGIQHALDKAKADIVTQAVAEFEAQVKELVGTVAVRLLSHYSVQYDKVGNLVITVKIDGPGEKS